jgi:hypothetical protein
LKSSNFLQCNNAQNRIWSSLLQRSTQKNFISFFLSFIVFLCILEVYNIFLKKLIQKMKFLKKEKPQHNTGGAAAVASGKLSRTGAYPWGSSDGDVATDGSVKEFVDGGGTPVASGGDSDLLQQHGRGGSEVRPDRAKGAARVELIEIVEGGGDRFRNAARDDGGSVTDANDRLRAERGGSARMSSLREEVERARKKGLGGTRRFLKGPAAGGEGGLVSDTGPEPVALQSRRALAVL